MATEGQGGLPDVPVPGVVPGAAITGNTSPRDTYQDERPSGPDAEVGIAARGPGATAVAGTEASESGHRCLHSIRRALKTLLPVFIALTCSAVCFGVAILFDNKIARVFGVATGSMSCFYGLISMPSRMSYLCKQTHRPLKIQICVWALCSFGDLCEGRQVELRERYFQEGPAKYSMRKAQSSPRSELCFLHPPRLENASCFVCMEDFASSMTVAVLRCGHVFCEPCMRHWATRHSATEVTCPLCRLCLGAEQT